MLGMKKSVKLDGGQLTINNINNIVKNDVVSVSIVQGAIKNLEKTRKFLDKDSQNKIIYGVNTGFGPMASYIIDKDHIEALQENLVLGHAVGMGDAVKKEFALAAMTVRLNTLVKGNSGISTHLAETLTEMINNRITPVIPEHGGVGASGDLTQLAHIAAAVIGEGDVIYNGKRQPTKKVFDELGIKPHKLLCKEGLALINGTSMMSGVAALICKDVERLISISIRLGCMSLELVESMDDSIAEKLHKLRPHKGQVRVAKEMREILSSSNRLKSRKILQQLMRDDKDVYKIDNNVQEFYSLRCIPQIVGPVLDILQHTESIVGTEINSVTDNPVIDMENGTVIHGGNFHGDYVASAVDQLKIGIVKLSMLSERRVNFFLHEKLNGKFPPFMNLKKPGLSMGLQGLQFVATSTTAQNQSFSMPHSIHSIPTNADNQDIVSMGTDATMIAAKVVENTFIVMAIELITLAQGIDYLNIDTNLSTSSEKIFRDLRKVFPKVYDDKDITKDLAKVVEYLKESDEVVIPLFK